ncbi:MAG: hypothetical protein AB1578_14755 [Thermodesulfobacteriota bacterium]
MKGLFSVALLAKLEEDLGTSLVDHFDLVVGTSTGGIIALGLGRRPSRSRGGDRMNWTDAHQRMALLRLHHEGALRSGAKTRPVIEHLLSLGWVGQTTRRGVVAAVPFARDDIRSLLDTVWPEWRRALTDLLSHSLPLSVENLSRLDRRAALADAKNFPIRLHRKTLAAVLGLHSKASLPTDDEFGETGVEATTDNVLRLRPNRGLRLQFARGEIDCDAVMAAAGEVILPERAFFGDIALSGVLPVAILTVENLGAYIDLPEVPGLLGRTHARLGLPSDGSFPHPSPVRGALVSLRRPRSSRHGHLPTPAGPCPPGLSMVSPVVLGGLRGVPRACECRAACGTGRRRQRVGASNRGAQLCLLLAGARSDVC